MVIVIRFQHVLEDSLLSDYLEVRDLSPGNFLKYLISALGLNVTSYLSNMFLPEREERRFPSLRKRSPRWSGSLRASILGATSIPGAGREDRPGRTGGPWGARGAEGPSLRPPSPLVGRGSQKSARGQPRSPPRSGRAWPARRVRQLYRKL